MYSARQNFLKSTSKEIDKIVNEKKYTGFFQSVRFVDQDGGHIDISIITTFKTVLYTNTEDNLVLARREGVGGNERNGLNVKEVQISR